MNHGGRRRLTATMVPHSRHQGIQQPEYLISINTNRLFSAQCVIDIDASRWFSLSSLLRSQMQQSILRLRRTRHNASPNWYIRAMFYCRGGAKRCLEEVQIAPQSIFFVLTKLPSDVVPCRQDTAPSADHTWRRNDTNGGSIPWMS